MESEKLMPCERWKRTTRCDMVEVLSEGRIRRIDGYFYKMFDNNYGYLDIKANNSNGKQVHVKVHRAVAEAFIPNPLGLSEVNHIDENKHNNRADNLEWCTSSYNKRYGNGRNSRSIGMVKVWEQRRNVDDHK